MNEHVVIASVMPRSSYRLGLLLVTLSTIAWSTAGLFTRASPLDAWTMLVWRGAFGASGLLVIMLLMQGPAALCSFRALGWSGWLLTGIGGAGMIAFITALRFTTVAHVAIIYATVPFLAGLLAWLMLREMPSASAVVASLAALLGVVIMVGVGSDGSLIGDALALAMTLSMAFVIVLARRYRGIPMLTSACVTAALTALVALPFSHAAAVSGYDLMLMALFGLVNSAAGLALFTLGARLLPPIETALLGALDAPLAPVWVWLIFGETPGRATLIGGAVVFVAVAAHVLREASRPAAA